MSINISKSRTKRSKLRAKASEQEETAPKHVRWSALFVAACLWVSVVLLFQSDRTATYSSLAPGQRAPATVIALSGFECEDIARTELNRAEAAERVPPVFTINHRPLKTATRALDKLFDRLLRLRSSENPVFSEEEITSELTDVIDLLELQVVARDVVALAPKGEEEAILETIKNVITTTWDRGIVSPVDRRTSFSSTTANGELSLRRNEDDIEVTMKTSDLLVPEETVDTVVSLIGGQLNVPPPNDQVLYSLVSPWIAPNLIYDKVRTEQRREDSRKAVHPMHMTVREGATIVERDQSVTPEVIEQLRAHEVKVATLDTPTERRLSLLGNGAILLIALFACGGLLKLVSPTVLLQPRMLVLLALLSLMTLVPSRALLYLASSTRLLPPGLVEYMAPLALAPLIATILVGSSTAVVLGIWTSLVAAIMHGNSFSVFTMGLIVTILSALFARKVRKRSQVFKAGLWAGLGQMVYSMSLAALTQPEAGIVFYQALTSLANGLLCAGIVLLAVPFFELLFGITTDISLLEYSDPGHPLLERLAKEAPGTYHHSLMVADLARAATSEIGGNELLVRVAAYFHDVGKLTKPEMFVENQQQGLNPHDALEPSMSTLIIAAHVKEGVALAQQHKLPLPIIHGIQQHHGTSLISFFYNRALTLADESKEEPRKLNKSDFRYPGPRPMTREMGILSLADGVEAASRAMSKPTSSRIRALVNDIVDSRIQDHQLDDSGLTLSELAVIKESLVFSLTSMLHARIEYPQDENRPNQPATASTQPGEDPEPGAVAHAERATA